MAPFPKGSPSFNPTGVPKHYLEARKILREWCSEHGIKRLVDLANSNDDRVALMATMACFDRAIGKPKEERDEAAPSKLDISALNDKDRAALKAILRKMVGEQETP